jgi:hypothetical protein
MGDAYEIFDKPGRDAKFRGRPGGIDCRVIFADFWSRSPGKSFAKIATLSALFLLLVL